MSNRGQWMRGFLVLAIAMLSLTAVPLVRAALIQAPACEPGSTASGCAVVTCDIQGVATGDQIACRPILDGIAQPDLPPGGRASYALTPAVHTLRMELAGASAGLWSPGANEHTLWVAAGGMQPVTSTFVKKGLLTITLSEPGAVGDFYVDGELIAAQVASAQAWVAPYKTHRVEGRNFTDPAADGMYIWRDAILYTAMVPGQQRTSTLRLTKHYLVGFVSLRCLPEDFEAGDGVVCHVKSDGIERGIGAPGQPIEFTLFPGIRDLEVRLVGVAAGRWEPPQTRTLRIWNGQTTSLAVSFDLLAQQPTPLPTSSAPPPPIPYTAVLSGLTPDLRLVYERGQQLGNNRTAISKIGDSETWNQHYLQPFVSPHDLGPYGYLEEAVNTFGGSFARLGAAAGPGLTAEALLADIWSDPSVCLPSEPPLECEYRLNKPAIALIMVRTWNPESTYGSDYHEAVRQIVAYSLDRGVIPVLSTLPHQNAPWPPEGPMNDTIRSVAAEYQVPLWDLALTTENLPNRGIDETQHLSIPPDQRSGDLTSAYMQYGKNRRNLEALEVLHAILHQVMTP